MSCKNICSSCHHFFGMYAFIQIYYYCPCKFINTQNLMIVINFHDFACFYMCMNHSTFINDQHVTSLSTYVSQLVIGYFLFYACGVQLTAWCLLYKLYEAAKEKQN